MSYLRLLALALVAAIAALPVFSQALTADQWRADVRYLADELPKRHPNAFKWMKREDFDAAVKALSDRAGAASRDEMMVGMMRIVAMIQDGHTSLFSPTITQSKFYPVRFYAFSDGLFIVRASPENKDLVGGRVIGIGNLSVDDAVKQVKTVTFSDNDMARLYHAPMSMSVPGILHGLKIVSDDEILHLTVEQGGKRRSVDLKPTAAFSDFLQPPDAWADAATVQALYRKDPANNFWFEYLKDSKTMYVQQNAVANKDNETVAAFYKRVFEAVEADQVDRFVLDLRFNGGGNNGLNRQVVIDILKSKIDVRGKLFVITGRETFSAAQNFVNELEKYTQAIFVGEPTAGHPNHFGDATPFVLPNSKFEVRASSVWWQDVDPRDRRVWTAPELAADLSSEDYRLGRDPAMQAIAEFQPGQTLRTSMLAAVEKGGVEIAKVFRAFRADPRHKYIQTEADMNRFGYLLLQQKKNAEAITIFELNVESNPRSANVYDSLGDAYQAVGRKADAIKAYEKALSIDPNYASSLESLRKLRTP
ncbi:MAG TPA: tetratricopeptide repeat protein [Pyrinomonadaceae bacterium]|jgi:tetratricopeptide (TPR) repeat protein|nr:tetratricopeptide repeat protein [Pyrinomonadaceae bacterium]